MLTWLLVNVVVSLLALVFIALNDTAPHRLRFFAGMAALAAWLVPWPLLPDLLPANMFSFELWRMERAVEVTSMRITGVIPVIVTTGAGQLPPRFIVLTVVEMGFIALTLIGGALFIWKVVAHRMLLRRLERSGGDGNWLWARAGLAPVCPVGVQREIAGAFSSGLLRPRIWVHGDLVNSPQLETLLRHELTHIRQHDNWYLLVITFIERVFWWNPLVWYLGRGTRELQELSCDELCQRTNSAYPLQLAQLMIESARGGQQPRMLALGANIFNNPNPNVQRIKLLQRSYPMMKKHILGAAVTATAAFLAVGLVTAQPEEPVIAGERVQVFTLQGAPGAGDDVLFVSADADAQRRVQMAGVLPGGRGDQFMKIDAIDGEETLSFKFTDVPLSAVLMSLVGFVNHAGPMAAMPPPGNTEMAIVRRLDVDTAGLQGLAPGTVPLPGAGAVAAGFVGHPLNDKLVLEYPEAANRIVSVTGSNLSLDEAIDLIAAESGCNIFQDGDTIVVDYCDE